MTTNSTAAVFSEALRIAPGPAPLHIDAATARAGNESVEQPPETHGQVRALEALALAMEQGAGCG